MAVANHTDLIPVHVQISLSDLRRVEKFGQKKGLGLMHAIAFILSNAPFNDNKASYFGDIVAAYHED